MDKPAVAAVDLFDACVGSVGDELIRTRLLYIKKSVKNRSEDYEARAINGHLYTFAWRNYKEDDVVIRRLSRKNLNDLYEQQMVGQLKPARRYYDDILASAPGRKCPYCGFGHARTLDHYLPKTRFPLFSITPGNLVPACRDCQSPKRAQVAGSAAEQPIHPYFDDDHFFTERWVFAKVVERDSPCLEYFVDPPADWSDGDKSRAERHFEIYGLAERYSIEAGGELASLRESYSHLIGDVHAVVAKELSSKASNEKRLSPNSWRTVMYEALSLNDWYCGGGFRL